MSEGSLSSRFCSLCHKGLVRSSNQDHTLTDESLGLWAVADGMGGHRKGDLASRLACETLHSSIKNGFDLINAFERAHAKVRYAQQQDATACDMGTTLVAVLETEDGFHLAWVGDSRAYLLKAADGSDDVVDSPDNANRAGLTQLTIDQNVASRLLERGEISAEQARRHPHRNVLTDCIGQREGIPRIESKIVRWHQGDRLLLCSDGLSGEVDEADLHDIMASNQSLDLICQNLVNQALRAGGGDNIAVLVLESD